jgi:hypothetical protein
MAQGRTITSGLDELRVKESDRLALMAAGLIAIGAKVEEREDGLVIDGSGGEPLAASLTDQPQFRSARAVIGNADLECDLVGRVTPDRAHHVVFQGEDALGVTQQFLP